MRQSFRILLSVCALSLAGCATRAPSSLRTTPAVPAPPAAVSIVTADPLILVSIDGYRPDYLRRGLSPNLEALASRGVRAQWMTPSFPTQTFPNHYTLVTGLYPDHHGIVANAMDDPSIQPDHRFTLKNREAVGDQRWWDEATPLWVSVQRQGGHAATMFWPGSEAPIQGLRPDHWHPFDARVTPEARVDQVLQWLDLPRAQRPQFITLYFDRVDHQAHENGPDSKEVDDALRRTDAALGRLVDGLERRHLYDWVNLVIVSDHGMAPVPARHAVFMDDFFDAHRAHAVMLGAIAGVAANAGETLDAHKLLASHPHMQCWRKSDIPARLHYGTNARIPPVVCLAQAGWILTTHEARAKRKTPERGDHGYDNADPLMRALFVAEGPAFRRGITVPPFSNLDVYPLLAHLLHVAPERNDGDYGAVKAMLKPGAR
ncbi:MAG TPA: ectonucleotide pyrophosphatase/phosphodiesterase [Rhodanobacteraceae bacterium]|nr:ectonucleotide pyrophosphatase/phosphodiesterase [Rhodanobacteraceae bacterium]